MRYGIYIIVVYDCCIDVYCFWVFLDGCFFVVFVGMYFVNEFFLVVCNINEWRFEFYEGVKGIKNGLYIVVF